MQAIEAMAQSKKSGSDHHVNGAVDGVSNEVTNDVVNGAASAAESNLPSVNELAGMLDNHKGKLAIGVAATLGLMVFYSWREKKLAKEDPEAHALHQKSKAIVRAAEHKAGRGNDEEAAAQTAANPARPVKDALPR
jgi:hypothetical protein